MTEKRVLRADAQRNRTALVAAARAAFDRGEEPIRFDDFAALAGLGVGTLYRHFPTREALAMAVYQGEVTALCDRARELLARQPAGEALATFLREFVDYVVTHVALARTLAVRVSGLSDDHAEAGYALERTVADLVAAARREGSVRQDTDPGALMLILHGVGAAASRTHWATESRQAVEMLLRGLKAT